MDITYYFDWGLELKKYGLISEYIHTGKAKLRNVFFAYFNVFVAILFFLGNAHFLVFLNI